MRLPDNQHAAVIGRVRSFFAVDATVFAVLAVMPAWCRSQAVIDVAPSSSHRASASNSPTAAASLALSRSATFKTSARASPSSGTSSFSTTSRSSPTTL
ncbi:MAG TPA: hypothetical protein VM938_11630 [Acidimicrobiales bacterium]|nr:hypothetical protein [Acidimicrobiales bacterium]